MYQGDWMRIFVFIIILYHQLFSSDIYFTKGWNFIGFNHSITVNEDDYLNDPSSVETVWTYTNTSTQMYWNVFSPDLDLTKELDAKHFNKLQKIENHEGVWINSLIKYRYAQPSQLASNIQIHTQKTAGWNLLSSLSGDTIIDMSIFDDARKIYVYRDGVWYAKFNDNDKNPFHELTFIDENEAYWIYYDKTDSQKIHTNALKPPSLPDISKPPLENLESQLTF
jgi:hypothetical protein